ncbi:putative polygalacturonase [Lupinus albus]|uniref:Putative polygalacturonase n=1 Tax=Lupinus albus TaxID=3870 RepID=A0A6A4QCE0_LUPAL|nr:putative polygalacturonase [Lupinus albus]
MQGGVISCILILSFVSPCLCFTRLNFGLAIKESSYNVMNYGAKGDGKSDDANAFLSAWKNACGVEGVSTLIIPKGKVFMLKDLELKGPCKATSIHIQLLGNIVAPNMDQWGKDKIRLIRISNVKSLKIDGEGKIEGNGSSWWQKCRNCKRPRLLEFYACNDLSVSYVNLANSPGAHISINSGDRSRFVHMNINAPSNSPNTDGFIISGSRNVVFEDSTIATGDDCIAIKAGSSYINATRLACGPGHGISVGSLGENKRRDTVEEVHVKNCTFSGTTNGARIKTWEGGSGYVRKVTFEDIKLIKTGYPIVIDQHYGTKNPNKNAGSLQISEVTFKGFEGTSADGRAISLSCSSNGCFNIILDQINIVSSNPKMKAQASCNNAHGRVGKVIPNVPCMLK